MLELVDELRVEDADRRAISDLLQRSFPEFDFAGRTYFKQLPNYRLLAHDEHGLVGHLGLVYRVIGTEHGPARILGVVDLCVTQRVRGRGLATSMLDYVESLARVFEIDYVLLFADDPRLYERSGFERVDNKLRWVKIDEHTTLGVGEEPVAELMVKRVGLDPWPSGTVDLLGYLF